MTSTNIRTIALRGISLFVAIAFTVTTLTGNPSQALALPEIFNSLGGIRPQTELRKDLYAMPQELGSLVSLWEPSAGNSPHGFVVQIQDAHANPEGQKNVAGMLKYLETKTPGLVIGLEGAAGSLHPEYLNLMKGFPDANRAVIEDLKQKGELNGVEQYLLEKHQKGPQTQDHGLRGKSVETSAPVSSLQSPVFGVEDSELYRDNLQTYRELLSCRDEIRILLDPIRIQLEKESSKKLSGELREFLKERSRRKEGRFDPSIASGDLDLQAYTRYLEKQVFKVLEIDLKDPIEQLRFPNLLRVVRIEGAQKGFDLEKVKTQWAEAVRSVHAAAREPGEKEFAKALSAFGHERGYLAGEERQAIAPSVGPALYPRKLLEGLFRFAQKHQLAFAGQEAFWQSWKLAVFQAEIDVTELLVEMNTLEEGLIRKLTRSEEEKVLVQKIGNFDLLEKMLRLELSREEYNKTLANDDVLRSFSAGSKPLDAFFAQAQHFYAVSLKRDEALVTNLLSLSPKPGEKTPVRVLYSGGFHTPGVGELLRQKNIGYAVFSPRITKTDHGEMYQKVMSGENADLSAYFKVKNPFATQQAAIFFKEILEVAAPALFEKYKMNPAEIASRMMQAVIDHPVLSKAVTASLSRDKADVVVHFQTRTDSRELSPDRAAVMAAALLGSTYPVDLQGAQKPQIVTATDVRVSQIPALLLEATPGKVIPSTTQSATLGGGVHEVLGSSADRQPEPVSASAPIASGRRSEMREDSGQPQILIPGSQVLQSAPDVPVKVRVEFGPHAMKQGLSLETAQRVVDIVSRKNAQGVRERGRSLYMPLDPSQYFSDGKTTFRTLMLKLVTYQGNPPQLRPYRDSDLDPIGQPRSKMTFDAAGAFHGEPVLPHPVGGGYVEEALNEYRTMLEAYEKGVRTGYPIGVGEFEDLIYEGKKLGFVIIALSEKRDVRFATKLRGEMEATAEEIQRTGNMRLVGEKFTAAYREMNLRANQSGAVLRSLLESGITHTHPHWDQFGLTEDDGLRIMDFTNARSLVLHPMSRDEFIFRAFNDLRSLYLNIFIMASQNGGFSNYRKFLQVFNSPSPLESFLSGFFNASERQRLGGALIRAGREENFISYINQTWMPQFLNGRTWRAVDYPMMQMISEIAGPIYDRYEQQRLQGALSTDGAQRLARSEARTGVVVTVEKNVRPESLSTLPVLLKAILPAVAPVSLGLHTDTFVRDLSSLALPAGVLAAMNTIPSKPATVSRRNFIKATALASGLIAFMGVMSSGAAEAPKPVEKPSDEDGISKAMRLMNRVEYQASLEPPGYQSWNRQASFEAVAPVLARLNAFSGQWKQLAGRGTSSEILGNAHRAFFQDLAKTIGSGRKLPQGYGMTYVEAVASLIFIDLTQFFAKHGLVFDLEGTGMRSFTTTVGSVKTEAFFPSLTLPRKYFFVLEPDARKAFGMSSAILENEKIPVVMVQPGSFEFTGERVQYKSAAEPWAAGQENEAGFANGATAFLRADLLEQMLQHDQTQARQGNLGLYAGDYSLRQVMAGLTSKVTTAADGSVSIEKTGAPIQDVETAAGYGAMKLMVMAMREPGEGEAKLNIALWQQAAYLETAKHEVTHVDDSHAAVWRIVWQIGQSSLDRRVSAEDRAKTEVLIEQSARLGTFRKTPIAYLRSLLATAQSAPRKGANFAALSNYGEAQIGILNAVMAELEKLSDEKLRTDYGISIEEGLIPGLPKPEQRKVQILAQLYRVAEKPERVTTLYAAVRKALDMEGRAEALASKYSFLDPAAEAAETKPLRSDSPGKQDESVSGKARAEMRGTSAEELVKGFDQIVYPDTAAYPHLVLAALLKIVSVRASLLEQYETLKRSKSKPEAGIRKMVEAAVQREAERYEVWQDAVNIIVLMMAIAENPEAGEDNVARFLAEQKRLAEYMTVAEDQWPVIEEAARQTQEKIRQRPQAGTSLSRSEMREGGEESFGVMAGFLERSLNAAYEGDPLVARLQALDEVPQLSLMTQKQRDDFESKLTERVRFQGRTLHFVTHMADRGQVNVDTTSRSYMEYYAGTAGVYLKQVHKEIIQNIREVLKGFGQPLQLVLHVSWMDELRDPEAYVDIQDIEGERELTFPVPDQSRGEELLSFRDSKGRIHLPLDLFRNGGDVDLRKRLARQYILAALPGDAESRLKQDTEEVIEGPLFQFTPAVKNILKEHWEGSLLAIYPSHEVQSRVFLSRYESGEERKKTDRLLSHLIYAISDLDESEKEQLLKRENLRDWFPTATAQYIHDVFVKGRSDQKIPEKEVLLAMRHWAVLKSVLPQLGWGFQIPAADAEAREIKGQIETVSHADLLERMFQKKAVLLELTSSVTPLRFFQNVLKRVQNHTLVILPHYFAGRFAGLGSNKKMAELINQYFQDGDLEALKKKIPLNLASVFWTLGEENTDGEDFQKGFFEILQELRQRVERGERIRFFPDFENDSDVSLNSKRKWQDAIDGYLGRMKTEAGAMQARHVVILRQWWGDGSALRFLKPSRSDRELFRARLEEAFGASQVGAARVIDYGWRNPLIDRLVEDASGDIAIPAPYPSDLALVPVSDSPKEAYVVGDFPEGMFILKDSKGGDNDLPFEPAPVPSEPKKRESPEPALLTALGIPVMSLAEGLPAFAGRDMTTPLVEQLANLDVLAAGGTAALSQRLRMALNRAGMRSPQARSEIREFRLEAVKGTERPSKTAIGIPLFHASSESEISLPPIKREKIEKELDRFVAFVSDIEHNIAGFFAKAPNAPTVQKKLTNVVMQRMSVIGRNLMAGQNELVANPYSAFLNSLNRWVEGLESDPATSPEDKAILPNARILMDHIKRMCIFELTPLVADEEAPLEVKQAEAERQYQQAVDIFEQQLKLIKRLQEEQLATDARAQEFVDNGNHFLADLDHAGALITNSAVGAQRPLSHEETAEIEAIKNKKQKFEEALVEAKKRIAVLPQKRAAAVFGMQHDVLHYEVFDGWLVSEGIKEVLIERMVRENKSLVSILFREAMVGKYAMLLRYQFTLPDKLKAFDEKLAVASLGDEDRKQLQGQRAMAENQLASLGDVVAVLEETATMIRRAEGEQRLTSKTAPREGVVLVIDKRITPSEYARYRNDLGSALAGIVAIVETEGAGGGADLMSHLKIVTQADSNSPALIAVPASSFRNMNVQMGRENEAVNRLMISAEHNQLIVNPGPDMLRSYQKEIDQQRLWENALKRFFGDLGLDASAYGFNANVVPGPNIGSILKDAGANSVGLKRAELFTPVVQQAVLHMIRELHTELELPAEEAGPSGRSESRKVEISLETLSPLLRNASVIRVGSLIEEETRSDMSAEVLEGRSYRVRGYDFRGGDKNPEIYTLLEAFRIIADPKKDAGFELYKNKFGALMLVLQLAALIIVTSEQAGKPGARPEFILPMVKSDEDLEYIRTVILPIAEEYARQRLLSQGIAAEASRTDAEEAARTAVLTAVERIRFGSMLETMESFQNLSKILALPFVKVLNVGLNDLEIAHINEELQRQARKGSGVHAERDDPWIQKIAGGLDPGFMKLIIGMAEEIEQHNARLPKERWISVCFCGEIASNPKFAPFMIYLRHRFSHVSFSQSMSPGKIAENLFVARDLRDVEAASLQYFSAGTYQADALASRLGMAPIEKLKPAMIVMQADQERSERQGLEQAFESPGIDVLDGLGGIADFYFLKAMLKSLIDPNENKEVLRALNLSDDEPLSLEELKRITRYLIQERMIVERDEAALLEAFVFVNLVHESYRQGNYGPRLYVGLMGDFLKTLTALYQESLAVPPRWASEVIRDPIAQEEAFELDYKQHTFATHLIIKRIIHEHLTRRFPPVVSNVVLLETLPDAIALEPLKRSEMRTELPYHLSFVEMQEEGWATVSESWVYGSQKYLSLELIPEGEPPGARDVPAAEKDRRERALYEYVKKHPRILTHLFLRSAQYDLRISPRTQTLVRHVTPDFLNLLRQVPPSPSVLSDTSVAPSDRAAIEKDFSALLGLDRNIAYSLVRMKRFGLLDGLLWTDQDFLHVTMPSLRALGAMENLHGSTKPVFYRAASVFKNVRSDPHAVKVFRLAVMMNAIIEAKPEKHWSDDEILMTLGESLLSAGVRDAVTIEQVVDLVQTYRRIKFETLFKEAMIAKLMMVNDEVMRAAAAEVLSESMGDESMAELKRKLQRPRMENKWRDAQLYLLAFANRLAHVDQNQSAMLHRSGPDNPLANLDAFHLGLQVLNGQEAGEEVARHLVELSQQAIAKEQTSAVSQAPLYSTGYQTLSRVKITQHVWNQAAGQYAQAVIAGNDAMQKQLRESFANAAVDFPEKLAAELEAIFSPYYLRNLDYVAYAREMIFLRHFQLLRAQGNKEMIPVVVNEIPNRFGLNHEILIGFSYDEPGLLKDFSRVLKENGFSISDADPHQVAGGGFIVRFVGSFKGRTEDVASLQQKLSAGLKNTFTESGIQKALPTFAEFAASVVPGWKSTELRQRHLDRLYGPRVVLRRQAGVVKKTQARFLPREPGELLIETAERDEPGLFLAIVSLLYEFGLNIENFRFNNLVWAFPQMLVYVSKDGKAVPEKDHAKITARLKEVLDRPTIEIRKGTISPSPVRSELRFLTPVLSAGAMGSAEKLSQVHRSEVREFEMYWRDQTTYLAFARAIFNLSDGAREELQNIIKQGETIAALWKKDEIDIAIHEQLVRFFNTNQVTIPRELEEAGVIRDAETGDAAPLIEYVDSALTRTKPKGLDPKVHLSRESAPFWSFKQILKRLPPAKRQELKRIVSDPWWIWFRGHFETYQKMTERAMVFFMKEEIPMPIDLIVQDIHRFTSRNLPHTPFLDEVREALGLKPPWDRRLRELFFPGSGPRSESRSEMRSADLAAQVLSKQEKLFYPYQKGRPIPVNAVGVRIRALDFRPYLSADQYQRFLRLKSALGRLQKDGKAGRLVRKDDLDQASGLTNSLIPVGRGNFPATLRQIKKDLARWGQVRQELLEALNALGPNKYRSIRPEEKAGSYIKEQGELWLIDLARVTEQYKEKIPSFVNGEMWPDVSAWVKNPLSEKEYHAVEAHLKTLRGWHKIRRLSAEDPGLMDLHSDPDSKADGFGSALRREWFLLWEGLNFMVRAVEPLMPHPPAPEAKSAEVKEVPVIAPALVPEPDGPAQLDLPFRSDSPAKQDESVPHKVRAEMRDLEKYPVLLGGFKDLDYLEQTGGMLFKVLKDSFERSGLTVAVEDIDENSLPAVAVLRLSSSTTENKIRALRALNPNVKIILVTGGMAFFSKEELRELGADKLLYIPFRYQDELLDIIFEYILSAEENPQPFAPAAAPVMDPSSRYQPLTGEDDTLVTKLFGQLEPWQEQDLRPRLLRDTRTKHIYLAKYELRPNAMETTRFVWNTKNNRDRQLLMTELFRRLDGNTVDTLVPDEIQRQQIAQYLKLPDGKAASLYLVSLTSNYHLSDKGVRQRGFKRAMTRHLVLAVFARWYDYHTGNHGALVDAHIPMTFDQEQAFHPELASIKEFARAFIPNYFGRISFEQMLSLLDLEELARSAEAVRNLDLPALKAEFDEKYGVRVAGYIKPYQAYNAFFEYLAARQEDFNADLRQFFEILFSRGLQSFMPRDADAEPLPTLDAIRAALPLRPALQDTGISEKRRREFFERRRIFDQFQIPKIGERTFWTNISPDLIAQSSIFYAERMELLKKILPRLSSEVVRVALYPPFLLVLLGVKSGYVPTPTTDGKAIRNSGYGTFDSLLSSLMLREGIWPGNSLTNDPLVMMPGLLLKYGYAKQEPDPFEALKELKKQSRVWDPLESYRNAVLDPVRFGELVIDGSGFLKEAGVIQTGREQAFLAKLQQTFGTRHETQDFRQAAVGLFQSAYDRIDHDAPNFGTLAAFTAGYLKEDVQFLYRWLTDLNFRAVNPKESGNGRGYDGVGAVPAPGNAENNKKLEQRWNQILDFAYEQLQEVPAVARIMRQIWEDEHGTRSEARAMDELEVFSDIEETATPRWGQQKKTMITIMEARLKKTEGEPAARAFLEKSAAARAAYLLAEKEHRTHEETMRTYFRDFLVGMTEADIQEAADSMELSPDYPKVLKQMRERANAKKIKLTFVVRGYVQPFQRFLERKDVADALEKVGVDLKNIKIIGNTLVMKDGVFTGELEGPVMSDKARHIPKNRPYLGDPRDRQYGLSYLIDIHAANRDQLVNETMDRFLTAFAEETAGRSEARSDLKEIHEKLYQEFMQLEPRVSPDGKVSIFDPEKLSKMHHNFETDASGNLIVSSSGRATPTAANVYSLYIPYRSNLEIVTYLQSIVNEIIRALPGSVRYFVSAPETYHTSVYVPQDLRGGDLQQGGDESLKLTARERDQLIAMMKEKLAAVPSYDLQLAGIRFDSKDGGVIAVFEDEGETYNIRNLLREEGSKVSSKAVAGKYPKKIILITLLRILDDIDAPTLKKLKEIATKYKDTGNRNLMHRVSSMEFGHEIGWMHTRFEEGSKREFPLEARSEARTPEPIVFDDQAKIHVFEGDEKTPLSFAIWINPEAYRNGESRARFDRVQDQVSIDGKALKFGDPSNLRFLVPIDQITASSQQAHSDEKILAAVPNGNPVYNQSFVLVVNGKVYIPHSEPVETRDYDMLVKFRDGRIAPMTLRFFDQSTVRRGIFDPAGKDLSNEIEYAVFGQRIVKDGQINVQNLANDFDDLRHLFRLPLFQRETVGQRHLGVSDRAGELYKNRDLVARALKGESIELSIAPILQMGFSLEEIYEVYQRWGYQRVEKEIPGETLQPGQFYIREKTQSMVIKLLPGIHPHNFIGTRKDGRLFAGMVEGKTHYAGASMARLAKELIEKYDAQDIYVWGNGKDVALHQVRPDGTLQTTLAENARPGGMTALLITAANPAAERSVLAPTPETRRSEMRNEDRKTRTVSRFHEVSARHTGSIDAPSQMLSLHPSGYGWAFALGGKSEWKGSVYLGDIMWKGNHAKIPDSMRSFSPAYAHLDDRRGWLDALIHMQFSPSGKHLVGAYANGEVMFWEPKAKDGGTSLPRVIDLGSIPGFIEKKMAISPDEHWFATSLGLWDLSTFQQAEAADPEIFYDSDGWQFIGPNELIAYKGSEDYGSEISKYQIDPHTGRLTSSGKWEKKDFQIYDLAVAVDASDPSHMRKKLVVLGYDKPAGGGAIRQLAVDDFSEIGKPQIVSYTNKHLSVSENGVWIATAGEGEWNLFDARLFARATQQWVNKTLPTPLGPVATDYLTISSPALVQDSFFPSSANSIVLRQDPDAPDQMTVLVSGATGIDKWEIQAKLNEKGTALLPSRSETREPGQTKPKIRITGTEPVQFVLPKPEIRITGKVPVQPTTPEAKKEAGKPIVSVLSTEVVSLFNFKKNLTPAQAMKILGITTSEDLTTEESLGRTWRSYKIQNHPDKFPHETAAEKKQRQENLAKAEAAYDFLLERASHRSEIRGLRLRGDTAAIKESLAKIAARRNVSELVKKWLPEQDRFAVERADAVLGIDSVPGVAFYMDGDEQKARLWIAMKLIDAFKAQQRTEGQIDNAMLQKVIASLERFKAAGMKDPTLEERGVHVALPLLTQAKLEALAEFAPVLLAFAVALNTKLYLNVQGAAPKGLEQKFLDAAARNGITVADGQFHILGAAKSEGSLFKSLKEPGVRQDALLAGEEKDLPGTDQATLWYNSSEAQKNMKVLAAEITEALYAALDPRISKGKARNIATHFQELAAALVTALQAFQSLKQSA